MKKDTNNSDLVKCSGRKMVLTMDDTEMSLSIISQKFRKNVRTKSMAVKKTVKTMLCKEMAQIKQNSGRLIHGKA